MTTAAAPAAQDVAVVRAEVQKVLSQCPAWRAMAAPQRQAFAQNMMKVGTFLAHDPGWLDAPLPAGAEALANAEGLAKALAPVDELKGRLAKGPGQVGQTFQAGAVRQGVEEFANLVQTVDFPEFVSGLIQGVFQAIVDASIQQMQAYGELLAATAKSVGEFANDHISDDQVRQQIASRHPGLVRIDRSTEGGGSRLVASEGAEDLSPLNQVARTNETISITDDASEQKFVTAAAGDGPGRQKLMAWSCSASIASSSPTAASRKGMTSRRWRCADAKPASMTRRSRIGWRCDRSRPGCAGGYHQRSTRPRCAASTTPANRAK